MKVLFASAVWNAEYVERFLNFCLPNLLSEGTLGGFAGLGESKFLLLTSRRDRDRFAASPVFKKLAGLIETEMVFMEDFTDLRTHYDKYSTMSACQIEAIRRSRDHDAIVLGYADFVWSAGSLQNALKRIGEGYDGVFCPGLPVAENAFCRALRERRELWGDAVLTVPPRVLVDLSLAHLHSLATANFWGRPVLSKSPAYQIWEVPGQGIVMRWFHLHPVVLRTRVRGRHIHRDYTGSLDDVYIPLIFDSTENLYFATDSDEIGFCSIMQDWQVEEGTRPLGVATLSSWAENNAALLHREFFNQAFRYHTTDMDPARWDPVVRKSEWVARQVEKRLLIPDSVLALMDPEAFGDRRARQERYSLRFPSWPGVIGEPPGTGAAALHAAAAPARQEIPAIPGATVRTPGAAEWTAHGAVLGPAGADGFLPLSELDAPGEHFAAIDFGHAAGSAVTARVRVRAGNRFNLRLYLIAESDSGYADFHLYGSGNVHTASAFGGAEVLGATVSSEDGDVFDCALSVRMPAARARTTARIQLLDYGRNSIYPGEADMGLAFAAAGLSFLP